MGGDSHVLPDQLVEPFDDRVDVQARDVEAGEARGLLVEHDGEIGAGEQDRLDAVAALQVRGDAAQVRRRRRSRPAPSRMRW